MPTIKHSQPRFAGYRVSDGQAKLYLPGQSHLKPEQLKAEVILPGAKQVTTIPMTSNGDYWVSTQTVPLGTDYRFRTHQKPEFQVKVSIKDQTPFEALTVQQKQGEHGVWEFTSPFEIGSQMAFQVPVQEDMPRIRAEKLEPGQDPQVLPVRREGQTWAFEDLNARPGTTYRLSPALDALEVVTHNPFGSFNRVSPHELNTPQNSTVMADVFLDSLVSSKRLKQLEQAERAQQGLSALPDDEAAQPHHPVLPVRNPYNQFAVDKNAPASLPEAGLNEMLPRLQQAGFSSVLLKPFIGGDNLTSHRYWTVDPYVLNNSFRDKNSFRDTLRQMLNRNMKLYADGAFVNQGLDGVHVTSNLVHGLASPYWRWLKAGDENAPGGLATYPNLAHKKYTFGVLPTKLNDITHLPELAEGHYAVRIINDPTDQRVEYDKKRPTFIELYDPRLEKTNGDPVIYERPEDRPIIKTSTDSVQKYRFPVGAQEVLDKAKKNELHGPGLLEWKRFRLDTPGSDDSGVKWDGQVNTAMLNTRNPEVLDYLKGAVGYWSRMVMNTHVGNVTEALMQAKAQHKDANLTQLLEAITQPVTPTTRQEATRLLPPAMTDAVLSDKALSKVYDAVAPDHTREASGKAFAQRMLEEVPLNVLPLPTLFKANLCYPGLTEALNPVKRGGFSNFMNHVVLGNLSRIPLLGHLFRAIRNFVFPKPFQVKLGEKLGHIFEQLSPAAQDKLRHGQIQSLLADRVSETLYLSLLTDLPPNEIREIQKDVAHPKRLEEAFYKGIPLDLLQADPVVAAELLPRLLNQRLDKLASRQIGNMMEAELKKLDPQLAAVAQAVLQKREMGLNWRIDAARDVGDMARVFETPAHNRTKVFQEEMGFVQTFWDKLTQAMRGPSNKTSIIAELTDFELLANNNQPVARQALKQFFDRNTFTGTPNMSYLYSPISQLIHYAQRPDEFGGSQIGPGDFLNQMQRSSEAVSFPALRDAQNLTSSHDYPTSSHVMMINPDLFTMDLVKWRGLKDDLTVSINELKDKACFAKDRVGLQTTLGLNQKAFDGVMYSLTKALEDPETAELLKDPDLKVFYSEATKSKNPATNIGTPHELKAKFVTELLGTPETPGVLIPSDLNLTAPSQLTALGEALVARIAEPSEAKAMRGVIVNAVLQDSMPDPQKQAIWDGLDAAVQKWGSAFGYQPLDIVLNHVFEGMTPEQRALFENPDATKLALYTSANAPVMDKLKRLFAVQAALPGNPSVYLQDLMADGGSEWTKNVQLQNRNLLRVDKFQQPSVVDVKNKASDFNNYFAEVGKIFGARTNPGLRQKYPQLEALNNGVLLPVTPNEESGILPIVRDNGKHQVITLVNVGQRKKLDDVNKTGVDEALQGRYATPTRNYKTPENYQPDFSELGLKEGTTYEDIYTHEQFELHEGRLQVAGAPYAGLPVNGWRMLVRTSKPSA